MPVENTGGGQGQDPQNVQPQPGQGDSGATGTAPKGGEGFNWELFPDVPEEQRPLLEPHLKNVQGHVTRLEQEHAPFKPFVEASLSAEDAQNLVNLHQAFDQDPVGTWIKLGENMQGAQAMSDDLDLAQVKAILNGEDLDEEGGEPSDEGGAGEEEMPGWAKQLQQELEAQKKERETQTQQQQKEQRQQHLEQALGSMRTQLKEAGFNEEDLTDQRLTAALIANNGDQDKALQDLTGLRESVLKGFTSKGNGSPSGTNESDLNMPKGAPTPPDRTKSRGPGKEFAEARAGAEQFLKSKGIAEAQE